MSTHSQFNSSMEAIMSAEHSAKAASTFKKRPKSSPSQIRSKFMAQVTGNSRTDSSSNLGTSLRPVKTIVLRKLRFDANYNINNFGIGYVERWAGIIEILVTEWKDQESQDCVTYFKTVTTAVIIWDRASKTDLLDSRSSQGQHEEQKEVQQEAEQS